MANPNQTSLSETLMAQVRSESGADDRAQANRLTFRSLALSYVRLGERANVEMKSYADESLPFFSALNLDEQCRVISALQTTLTICQNTLQSGYELRDSRALVWNALRQYQLRPPSDLFTMMTSEGDVVELHNEFGVQIFRNFNFFKLCSYSVEDLYCRHWQTLFGRDQGEVNSEIFNLMTKVFSGQDRTTFFSGVRPHTVFEISSVRKIALHLEIRYAASLFRLKTQEVGASIVIETAHPITERSQENAVI